MDVCHTVTPALRLLDDGSRVACHLYEEQPDMIPTTVKKRCPNHV